MRKISSSDQRGDFRKTAEQIIRFFLIIARIDEARVGYGGNAHLRGLGSSDPGKSVLDDEAAIYGYAELHHFVAGHREAKLLLVKLDGEPVTHCQHVSVLFAAISNAMFGEQFRVNLVPPRLGVGEDAIQVEDHSVERLRHEVGL